MFGGEFGIGGCGYGDGGVECFCCSLGWVLRSLVGGLVGDMDMVWVRLIRFWGEGDWRMMVCRRSRVWVFWGGFGLWCWA